MGRQFVPDLGRARTVLEAPSESGLGLLQVAVAGVADPKVRVGLPPVGRPRYDLLVSPYGLGVAAGVEEGQASVYEHVGVFWHAVRPALEGCLRQRGLPHKAVIAA